MKQCEGGKIARARWGGTSSRAGSLYILRPVMPSVRGRGKRATEIVRSYWSGFGSHGTHGHWPAAASSGALRTLCSASEARSTVAASLQDDPSIPRLPSRVQTLPFVFVQCQVSKYSICHTPHQMACANQTACKSKAPRKQPAAGLLANLPLQLVPIKKPHRYR
ncbi:hypothetical protein O181_072468 [Austropuccinia psidii MF-1]|uniref:Uncharacterized protein n=1 Tax=Austropuccinia psidii MF-1 TaxID=1389203 RepID=A0A9Q3F7G8_9BASI|nr:hypothetical protein [Austropuccinia psidii MF-1]